MLSRSKQKICNILTHHKVWQDPPLTKSKPRFVFIAKYIDILYMLCFLDFSFCHYKTHMIWLEAFYSVTISIHIINFKLLLNIFKMIQQILINSRHEDIIIQDGVSLINMGWTRDPIPALFPACLPFDKSEGKCHIKILIKWQDEGVVRHISVICLWFTNIDNIYRPQVQCAKKTYHFPDRFRLMNAYEYSKGIGLYAKMEVIQKKNGGSYKSDLLK
ncbi:hypothetical protein ACJX0J_028176, partial [Zea mays]